MTDNTPTTKQEEGGLVTVPREPTWEMLNAAVDLTNAGSGMSWVNRSPQKLFAQAWSAMVALAPATPPHNEDGLRKALEEIAGSSVADMLKHAKSDQDYVAGLRAHIESGGEVGERNINDLIYMVEWGVRNLIDIYTGEAA